MGLFGGQWGVWHTTHLSDAFVTSMYMTRPPLLGSNDLNLIQQSKQNKLGRSNTIYLHLQTFWIFITLVQSRSSLPKSVQRTCPCHYESCSRFQSAWICFIHAQDQCRGRGQTCSGRVSIEYSRRPRLARWISKRRRVWWVYFTSFIVFFLFI